MPLLYWPMSNGSVATPSAPVVVSSSSRVTAFTAMPGLRNGSVNTNPGCSCEVRRHGRQPDGALHAAALRRRAEEVVQRHPRQVRRRVEPRAARHLTQRRGLVRRVRDLLDDSRTDAQPVRLVLLDAERRITEALATSVFVHQVDACPVDAGRRLRTGLEVPGEQPVVRQGDAGLERRVAARVGDPHLDRRARNGPEVALPHDAEQARRLARPIQPAVRVERGPQTLGVILRRAFATYVEPGPGQAAVRRAGRA